MDIRPEKYLNEVASALAGLERRGVVRHIWQKDHTAWQPDPREITDRLGWLTIIDLMREQVPTLESFASSIRDAGFRQVVLLGMGGSSLGPEVLRATFGRTPGYPELIVLDSTVPSCVRSVTEAIDPARTLFLVSSKSGTTLETLSLFSYCQTLVTSAIGQEKAGENFAAITDPDTPLAKLAEEADFRHLFLNPPDIGGRYSVLSYFGLVPAALGGINITTLLDRAESQRRKCLPNTPLPENPGAWLGSALATLAQQGRDKLTLVTSPAIRSLGLWIEQLIAESTGKAGKGIIPVIGEPMMAPACYQDDRLFIYLRLQHEPNSATDEDIKALTASGQPVIVLEMRDRYDLGGELFRWEFATAVAGAGLAINPFDQPDVEMTKQATEQVLQQFLTTGRFPQAEVTHSPEDLLAEAEKGDYLAILAYLRPTSEMDEMLTSFRRQVLEKHHIATTVGYGPRYLHSTGQLHKGGPGTGLFLFITAEHEKDLSIPGQPYSFGTLADAQATGDLQALRLAGRHVARVHCDREDVITISRQLAQLAKRAE